MPTIPLHDDELAAVIAALRGVIESDRFPHAPRLDPLRAALARFEEAQEPTPPPKARRRARARSAGADEPLQKLKRFLPPLANHERRLSSP
jgi:hypothetical protein